MATDPVPSASPRLGLRHAYLLALTAIAGSIAVAHLSLGAGLDQMASDAYLVNLAGRQRMLSQKVAKEASCATDVCRAALEVALGEWQRAHGTLLARLGEWPDAAPVAGRLAELTPLLEEAAAAARPAVRDPAARVRLDAAERAYLPRMHAIVGEIEGLSKAKLDALRAREAVLTWLALALLAAEALLIFEPLIRRLRAEQRSTARLMAALASSERALAARSAGLEASRRFLADLTVSTSHDLREPVRKILVFAERLSGALSAEDARAQRDLSRVRGAAERLLEMLSGLGEICRVPDAEPSGVAVELDAVAAGVVAATAERVAEAGASLTVLGLPAVAAQAAPLQRVMEILVDNALVHRHPDRAPEITIAPLEGGAGFVCRDNGLGFDPASSERIFEAFRTLGPRRTAAGTGLTLARRIVESYGGRMWAEGAPGQGATFHVALEAPAAGASPGD